jgi:hypothetical protein
MISAFTEKHEHGLIKKLTGNIILKGNPFPLDLKGA